jgi:hypothetical protein
MSDVARSFVARIDDLVHAACESRCTAEQAAVLGCYLDILLAHRPVAGLLARCPQSAATCSCEGAQAHAAVEAVHRLLVGPDPDLGAQVRAAMAVAGLHGAVAGLHAAVAGLHAAVAGLHADVAGPPGTTTGRCSTEDTAILRSAAMTSSLSVLACRG